MLSGSDYKLLFYINSNRSKLCITEYYMLKWRLKLWEEILLLLLLYLGKVRYLDPK